MEIDITEAQFARFGKSDAAILGTSPSWGGEAIDEVAKRELGHPVGSNAEAVRVAWRRLAIDVDIDFDREDVCRVDRCLASLDDGEGQDGFCGTHADERYAAPVRRASRTPKTSATTPATQRTTPPRRLHRHRTTGGCLRTAGRLSFRTTLESRHPGRDPRARDSTAAELLPLIAQPDAHAHVAALGGHRHRPELGVRLLRKSQRGRPRLFPVSCSARAVHPGNSSSRRCRRSGLKNPARSSLRCVASH